MTNKKTLKYYLNLDWTYTIEQETYRGKRYYIIRVNELPGICIDAETIEEGLENIKEAIAGAVKLYMKNKEPVPEPIKKKDFKGNISYRTTSERHYHIAQLSKQKHKSISKTIDDLIDLGLGNKFQPPAC